VGAKNVKHGHDGETVERLLNAAEKLFAKEGYDGVGMRALAREAKANLGAVTYHFGSKKALYVETFMRRFRPVNAERVRLLQEAQTRAPGGIPPVEKIVECMIRPPYMLGLKHPGFHLLIVRNHVPPPFLRAAMKKEMMSNAEIFIKALARALPHLPEKLVRLRSFFIMSTLMAVTSHPTREHSQSEECLREIIRFAAAGVQSPPASMESAI
jgi:AcrR family transcriptional regulator